MQLHDARKADLTHKKRLRVGRGPGSGIGKTSGRGIKGATSRSGYTMKVTYEGGQMPLFRRLPKRGFRNGPFRVTYCVVNLADLAGFKAGSKIGPDELRASGVLQGPATWPVKILGNGDIKVALTVSADAFSKSAVEKIEKAGGKADWIGGAPKKPAPNFKQIDAEKKRAEKNKPAAPKAEGAAPAGAAAPAAPAAPKAEKK